ncbi:hypothetical protein ACN47E_004393 [Coniothyrium glycines]
MATLTFHNIALTPVINGLKNAHFFINKGYEYAQSHSIDPNDFLSASLHPDMRDFRFQVHRFTDIAKGIPSRVNPQNETLTFSDDPQTFPELLERIEKTIKYLEGIDESSFEGRDGEKVVMQFRNGELEATYSGLGFVMGSAHPNFWFHVTTAYDILRHKGVDLGKVDFLNGAKLVEIKPVAKPT